MADLKTVGSQLTGLTGVAVRSFLGTLLVFLIAGPVFAAAAGFLLRHHLGFAVIGAVVAFLESLATGCVLGLKRAYILAAAHGVQSSQLGRKLVGIVFDRILLVSADGAHGDRGGQLARGAETLPLKQAEQRLTAAIDGLANPEGKPGGLRARLQRFLLNRVKAATLSRFRDADAEKGGVDLLKVRAELEDSVDAKLVERLKSGLNLWTIIVIVGLPAAIAVQTWIAIALLTRGK